MDISLIVKEFAQVKVKKELLETNLVNKVAELGVIKIRNEAQVKARWVLTEVSQQTQRRFQDKVERLLTMAIQTVFDRPFEFKLEFERKRNKMECKPTIIEGDRIYDDPEYDLGGGVLDIISFAFRIVLWSLQNPRSRNVIILDEPMKNMGKLISLGGQVLREISHSLNLQLIIVTHDDELIDIGDRVFQVTHDGIKSHIKCIKGDVEHDTIGDSRQTGSRKTRIIR
jgi:hypothetical protein